MPQVLRYENAVRRWILLLESCRGFFGKKQSATDPMSRCLADITAALPLTEPKYLRKV
jgi:hypothetical protein